MALGYLITGKSITVVLDGKSRTITSTNPAYADVREALKGSAGKDEALIKDELLTLLDMKKFVNKKSFGKLEIGDTEVRYEGKTVASVIGKRILDMFNEGFDVTPLVNFYENMKKNPGKYVEEELYLFLEHNEISITPDGHVLAFKRVNVDYMDFYTGKHRHKVGDAPEMDRKDVDTNRNNTCSTGFHFCSASYLPHYHGGSGRVVIVKIDPADIVSIPCDYANAKGRACKYLVVDEIIEEEVDQALGRAVDNRYPAGNGGYSDDTDYMEDAEGDDKADAIWVHRGREFYVDDVLARVAADGVPTVSKELDIPQSTLRDFVKRH